MLEVLVIVFAYTFHRAGERALQRRAGPHPCIFTDVAHEEAAQVIADTRLEAGAGNWWSPSSSSWQDRKALDACHEQHHTESVGGYQRWHSLLNLHRLSLKVNLRH